MGGKDGESTKDQHHRQTVKPRGFHSAKDLSHPAQTDEDERCHHHDADFWNQQDDEIERIEQQGIDEQCHRLVGMGLKVMVILAKPLVGNAAFQPEKTAFDRQIPAVCRCPSCGAAMLLDNDHQPLAFQFSVGQGHGFKR